ncbi:MULTISPECIES: hypothetical protein [Pseudomonas]|uniref:hypothetical protein n=1 Tax=Pseudomonas TaxID=286 RepID=UPI001BEBEB04|nr:MULTISPECIES: hypothetical protein [Pseudomonas]MBT2339503.1 hypothetical protein [Pseudomonas fluorescens]MCD4528667.1 hypothetical protein [Pseudomonas sp. C3-2018]
MKDAHKVAPYSLRIDEQLKARAREAAVVHRRSLNAELEQLIEEGFKWREIQNKQAIA